MSMLKTIRQSDSTFADDVAGIRRTLRAGGLVSGDGAQDDVCAVVGEIISKIAEGGDDALIELEKKLDNAELAPETIRVEVHGRDTSRLPVFSAFMKQCESPNVFTNWNCNDNDLEDGGLEHNFSLVADSIHFVHMRDLYLESYPWRKFFSLLNGIGYKGYCCAEIPPSSDPLRVMRYYRALFLAYQDRL